MLLLPTVRNMPVLFEPCCQQCFPRKGIKSEVWCYILAIGSASS